MKPYQLADGDHTPFTILLSTVNVVYFISCPPADNRLGETPASSVPAEVNWNEREMRSSTEEQSLLWIESHGRQRIEDQQGKSQEKSRGKLWIDEEERLGVEEQKTDRKSVV